MNRTSYPLLPIALVFALSGCAGLMHEVAWSRVLGQSLGGSLVALTAVLTAFLGGLGLGAAIAARLASRRRDPLRVYAALEILLALCGLAAPLLARTLPSLLEAAGHSIASDSLLGPLRFTVAVIAVAPSTLLMGATLPLLVREAELRGLSAGASLAVLYGANTLGAAFGALFGSFACLPFLGTRLTFLAAGLLNAAAGGTALLLWRRRRAAIPQPSGHAAHVVAAQGGGPIASRGGATVTLVAALSGMAGAVLQIGWTRVVALSFGSTAYALGTTLAAYILGLGAGPLMIRRRLARDGGPLPAVAALAGAGLLALLLVPVLGRLPIAAAMLSGWIDTRPATRYALQFAMVAALLFLPSLAQGMVLPALTVVASGGGTEPHRVAGRLYAASTWGSVAGAVCAGFAAIPIMGTRLSLVLASALSMLSALLLLSLPSSGLDRSRSRPLVALALVLGACALPFLLPGWDSDLMSGGGFLYGPVYRSATGHGRARLRELIRRRGRVLFEREDGAGLVTVRRSTGGIQSLQINGKTEASTGGDMGTQLLSAHLPLLLHPRAQDVLVIGLASGVTLGGAERHPVRSIDVIEIAPRVVDAARLFSAWNGRALDDPRSRVILDDARARLILRSRRYDVITSQPSNPWVAGVSNLFTTEFYRLVRTRLNPGGLFCQWVQAYRLAPDDFRGIIASFLRVFPDATLWEESAGGGDYFLLGGDAPLRPDPELMMTERRQEAWGDLRRAGLEGAADLLSRFVSGPQGLRELARGARPHTDDNLYLETRAPLAMFNDSLREQVAALRRIREPVLSILPGGIAAREPSLADALRARERQRDLRLEIAAGLKDADLWSLADPDLAAGIAALRAGVFGEAVTALSRAASANPDSGTAHFLLGEAYRASGLAQAAIVAYAEAVRRDPRLAPAWNSLGRALSDDGNAEGAVAAFRSALLVDPRLAVARNNLAAAHLRAGEIEEAERDLRQAVHDDPGLAAAQANLGLLLKRRGDMRGAEARYRTALDLDPLNADARYNLAALLEQTGRHEESRREIGRILANDPVDPDASALLRDIERRKLRR